MQRSFVCLALIVIGVASCKASGEGTDYGGSGASGGAAGGAVGGAGGAVTEAGLDVGVSDAFTDVNPIDTPSNGCPGQVQSFIWIANT
ncbi:MAG: hypothetical protein CVU63_10200 [Deltaproteobacteria bacterium HGW-Deltaproteobacteria-20]|jgi:hypothetical protein|nr:MAG: hypothetical protein CVU63_10200 [Deltaproteobacteria bacterium HGW-Deltaproteobacteria-20]